VSDSSPTSPVTPPFAVLLRDPVHFLAFGFGSGLAPRAPGTVGTIVALLLYLPLAQLNLAVYTTVVVLATAAGIWICGASSKRLGVHDHGGIVWDEFVGLWITLWAVPLDWRWLLLGFLLFRFFDVVKPWPIRVLDRRVHGGFGIMVDDMVAGVMAGVCLHLVINWLG